MLELPNGFFIDSDYFDIYSKELSPLEFVIGLLIQKYTFDPLEYPKGVSEKKLTEIINSFKGKSKTIQQIRKALHTLIDKNLIEKNNSLYFPKQSKVK